MSSNFSASNELAFWSLLQPDQRFQVWTIDLIGPMPTNQKEGCYLLLMLDLCTRFIELVAINSCHNVEHNCYFIFNRNGTPRTVICPNSYPFISDGFKQFIQINGIEQQVLTIPSAEHNLFDEYKKRILHAALEVCGQNQSNWHLRFIPKQLHIYNNDRISTIGFSPINLLYSEPSVSETKFDQTDYWLKQLQGQMTACSALVFEKARRNYLEVQKRRFAPEVYEFTVLEEGTVVSVREIVEEEPEQQIWSKPWVVLRVINSYGYECGDHRYYPKKIRHVHRSDMRVEVDTPKVEVPTITKH